MESVLLNIYKYPGIKHFVELHHQRNGLYLNPQYGIKEMWFKNQPNVFWRWLSENESDYAIKMLEENINFINKEKKNFFQNVFDIRKK